MINKNFYQKEIPKFYFKIDLVKYIKNEISDRFFYLQYDLMTEKEIKDFMNSVIEKNLDIIDKDDLEIVFEYGSLNINSKTGFNIEELI
jgi:sensor histidine kinase YesM